MFVYCILFCKFVKDMAESITKTEQEIINMVGYQRDLVERMSESLASGQRKVKDMRSLSKMSHESLRLSKLITKKVKELRPYDAKKNKPVTNSIQSI